MKTECSKCHQHYEVEDEYLNETVECPQCGGSFVVKPREPTRIPLNMARVPKEVAETNLMNSWMVLGKFGRCASACVIGFLVLLLAVVFFHSKMPATLSKTIAPLSETEKTIREARDAGIIFALDALDKYNRNLLIYEAASLKQLKFSQDTYEGVHETWKRQGHRLFEENLRNNPFAAEELSREYEALVYLTLTHLPDFDTAVKNHEKWCVTEEMKMKCRDAMLDGYIRGIATIKKYSRYDDKAERMVRCASSPDKVVMDAIKRMGCPH